MEAGIVNRVSAQDTPAKAKPDLQLEIAHILLIDVVGYSKLLVNEQIKVLQELNRIGTKHQIFSCSGSKQQTHPGADW